jgi:hypothetical protein
VRRDSGGFRHAAVVPQRAAAYSDHMTRAAVCLTVVLALTSCASPGSTPAPADGASVAQSPAASLPPSTPPSAAGRSPQPPSPSPRLSTPADNAWEATWAEERFPGTVHGVAVDGDRVIAVGRDSAGLAAWISRDVVTWERYPVPDPTVDTPIPDGWGMGPIVRLGEALLSFGRLHGAGDYRRPVAWRSSDGAGWEFIESRSEFYQYGDLSGVVASDSALVAVTDGGLIAPYRAVWRWTAETSWTKSDLASTSNRPLMIHDVAWGDGTYLAVGAHYDPENAEQWYEALEPGLWRSSDGQSWSPLAVPPEMVRGCTVAATGDGFLLVGVSAGRPHSWSSSDGHEWSRIAPVGDATDGTCWDGLSTVSGGFVAVRNTGSSLVVSVSRDATTWSDSEFPDLRSSDTLVAVLGEQVLVFAGQTSGEGASVVLHSPMD